MPQDSFFHFSIDQKRQAHEVYSLSRYSLFCAVYSWCPTIVNPKDCPFVQKGRNKRGYFSGRTALSSPDELSLYPCIRERKCHCTNSKRIREFSPHSKRNVTVSLHQKRIRYDLSFDFLTSFQSFLIYWFDIPCSRAILYIITKGHPMNTEQALNEIGERLKRHRLNRNLTQKEVAERAGIGLASVARLEDGKGSTLVNFIRVLTALDALDSLDTFLPMPSISPIQLAKLHGKERQKASKKS